MTRPYELYIRFLVTKGYSELDAINERLEDMALLPIEASELDRVFNQIHDLLPKSISNIIDNKFYNKEFLKWMKVIEVSDLWELEKPFKRPDALRLQLLYDINYDPGMRSALRALLIKAQKHSDICQALNFKFSYMLRPEHVALYEKFFWCPARMTRKSWKEYIKNCNEMDKELLFLCLSKSVETVKTFLHLPSKVDVVTVYNRIFTQCAEKVDHYIKTNTKDGNTEARLWTDTLMQLGDKIKKHEASDIQDFGKALQMEFDFISSDFPSPDEAVMKEIEELKKTEND